jgi:hypothetical protein
MLTPSRWTQIARVIDMRLAIARFACVLPPPGQAEVVGAVAGRMRQDMYQIPARKASRPQSHFGYQPVCPCIHISACIALNSATARGGWAALKRLIGKSYRSSREESGP